MTDVGREADILTLVQWLSPAFPVGAFAYSHGLESAIAQGCVRDRASAADWIATVLRKGSGRVDAALLAAAMRAQTPAELADVAAEAEALAASAERALEMREQGAAFVRTVNAVAGLALPPLPLPVAVGAASATLGLQPAQVAAHYLHAFAGTLVSCAVRAVPLGQTEGQAMLAALRSDALAVAAEAVQLAPRDLGTAAVGSDLAAMAHETLEVRLYRT